MGLFGNSDQSSSSSLSWDLKGIPNPSDDIPVRIGFSFENSGLKSTMFGRSYGSMDTSANVPTKPRFIWPEVNIRRSWTVLEINNPRTRDAIEKKTSKCWVDMQEFIVKLKEDYVKELSDRTNLAITEAAESCCREFMKDVTRNRPGPGTAWYIMDREDCLKFNCLLWEEEFNSIAPGRPDVCCVNKVEPCWLPSEWVPPEKGKDVVRSCSGDGDGDGDGDGVREAEDAVREAELLFSKSLIKGGRFLPISEMARLRGYPSTSNPFSSTNRLEQTKPN